MEERDLVAGLYQNVWLSAFTNCTKFHLKLLKHTEEQSEITQFNTNQVIHL